MLFLICDNYIVFSVSVHIWLLRPLSDIANVSQKVLLAPSGSLS